MLASSPLGLDRERIADGGREQRAHRARSPRTRRGWMMCCCFSGGAADFLGTRLAVGPAPITSLDGDITTPVSYSYLDGKDWSADGVGALK